MLSVSSPWYHFSYSVQILNLQCHCSQPYRFVWSIGPPIPIVFPPLNMSNLSELQTQVIAEAGHHMNSVASLVQHCTIAQLHIAQWQNGTMALLHICSSCIAILALCQDVGQASFAQTLWESKYLILEV